jgi:hypothetical protein
MDSSTPEPDEKKKQKTKDVTRNTHISQVQSEHGQIDKQNVEDGDVIQGKQNAEISGKRVLERVLKHLLSLSDRDYIPVKDKK